MIRSLIKIAIVLVCSLLLFQSNSLKAQVISNNVAISVSSGIVVQGDTLENNISGLISNNGVVALRGHFINSGATIGDGIYNIAGNWVNTGIFNPGASTVNFLGNSNQSITSPGGEIFNNLSINNSGASSINRIILLNSVNVSGTLTITLGNIETGANKLFLSNQSSASLNYTSTTGSRVIGQFERGIDNTGNYLFPIGSNTNYNPLNLNMNIAPVAGSVLSEFINTDPGSAGLPFPDDSVEVYQAYDDGYWSLTANGFSSDNFNINMDGAGFTPAVQDITRIIKRQTGGDWSLDGTHSDAIGSVTYRNTLTGGISVAGNHFGFGQVRPRIWTHPADTAVCDGTVAMFTVTTTGRGPLTYQWQENQGSGWANISDGSVYLGTNTAFLRLFPTTLSMSGYQYRVIITDYHGNFTVSNPATLTVNPIPEAFATPDSDTLCNNGTISFVVTSDVPGTTFELEVVYSGSITGASSSTGLVDGETINQILTNPGDDVDSVIYRIIPTGPDPTDCVGICDTVKVWVNPTPRAIPVIYADRICNLETAEVELTTPTVMTHGILQFDYTVTLTSGAVGNSDPFSDLDQGHLISFSYENSSDTVQSVFYHITPKSVGTGCASGPIETAEVKIHPIPVHDIVVTNPLTCGGGSDLALRAIVSSGTEPLSIDWYGPFGIEYHDTLEIGNLYGGTYYITVTDNLGCVASDQEVHTKAIPTPVFDPILKDPYYIAHTECYDSNDGEMLVGIQTSENLPFTYWVVRDNSDTVKIDTLRYEFDQLDPATYDTIHNLIPG
ncbi:MAG: hypothetical protein K8R35_09385, partial [Bacteroidales bacterium]|nr:hypothetical protein [Bacteroidales bacterium]